MTTKLKLKPFRIFQTAIFPLIAGFSIGLILFLRPFNLDEIK